MERSLLRKIDDKEIVELTRSLVRIPSVNPPGDEKEIAEFIASWFDKRHFRATITEAVPNRPNIEVRFPEGVSTSKERTLVFNGHMDVVPVGSGWSHDPFGGEIENGRVYGRGSGDMKGGLAALMIAMNALKSIGEIHGRVIFQAVADEEGGGRLGTAHLVKSGLRADFGIVAEPTSMRICIAHRGIVTFEIITYGKAAHASAPPNGINAILKMDKVIKALAEYSNELNRSHCHPALGYPTLNVGVIQGGTRANIVPDRCWISAERRLVPPERAEAAIMQLRSLLGAISREDSEFVYDFKVDHVREASEIHGGKEGLGCMMSSLHEFREYASPEGFPAACDAGFLENSGIPTVIIGPGALSNAHTVDEYVEIDELQVAARVYTLAALKFLR